MVVFYTLFLSAGENKKCHVCNAAIHDKTFFHLYRQRSAFATVIRIFSVCPGTKSTDQNLAPRRHPLSHSGGLPFLPVPTLVSRASIYRYIIEQILLYVIKTKSQDRFPHFLSKNPDIPTKLVIFLRRSPLSRIISASAPKSTAPRRARTCSRRTAPVGGACVYPQAPRKNPEVQRLRDFLLIIHQYK